MVIIILVSLSLSPPLLSPLSLFDAYNALIKIIYENTQ